VNSNNRKRNLKGLLREKERAGERKNKENNKGEKNKKGGCDSLIVTNSSSLSPSDSGDSSTKLRMDGS